jgi:ribosomal protein S18 acetylase RimI-like enzyme
VSLELRKATASDSEFAYHVKKAAFKTCVDQVWGWDETEQRRLHEERFASQNTTVIRWSGTELGIMVTVREQDCIKLNQLFILPDYQGQGIGVSCVEHVVSEASASGLSVRLRVLKVNSRALAFFRRLGFEKVGKSDTHTLLELAP